jgi:hypothetical protein
MALRVPRNRDFEAELKQQTAVTARQRALWDGICRFVHVNRGWVTSTASEKLMRIEVRPDSDLIDKLTDRGFKLQAMGTSSRIEGGIITPVCIYNLHLPPLGK